MKEELEKLGFIYRNYSIEKFSCWSLFLDGDIHTISVRSYDKMIIINGVSFFKYNHEKLKQLIKLLS